MAVAGLSLCGYGCFARRDPHLSWKLCIWRKENTSYAWVRSGGRRNALVFGEEPIEFLARGAVAEALSGTVVEFVLDGLEPGGVAGRQVGALGEVLAQQAVGVLVAAALPGGVGVGEVD